MKIEQSEERNDTDFLKKSQTLNSKQFKSKLKSLITDLNVYLSHRLFASPQVLLT